MKKKDPLFVVKIHLDPCHFASDKSQRIMLVKHEWADKVGKGVWMGDDGSYINEDEMHDTALPHLHFYVFAERLPAIHFLDGIKAGAKAMVASAMNLLNRNNPDSVGRG